ncbi:MULTISPECIES: flavin reductase family protein [unclassified Streptomyces]|uniref:flavin reductase family protein n=1 Tax=unclassified Streptomyces TaxID=2593676 RepID=UPI002E2998ED|nr:flavin reductase family protein [Streptomyces sp. NBC_00223]
MAVESATFREMFGMFPTAVSIVTAMERGEPRGLTCSAVSAVSMDPPLLLVCVDKASRTLNALMTSEGFVVNVLAAGGQDIARLFASSSVRKFAGVPWLPSSWAGGAPLLTDVALACAECSVEQTVEAGDHWIFIGRVEEVSVFPRQPLLHQRGRFDIWTDRAQEPQARR